MPCSLTLRNDETSAMVSVLRLRSSELDHDLDGFTIVHRTVAVGYAVDIRGAVEHEPRLDSAFQYVGHELVHVRTNGRRTAGDCDVGVERRLRTRERCFLGNPDSADRTAGARDAHGRAHRLAVAHAFEDGMGT